MRLLVITAAYPPHRSGEATNAYYLCQHLAQRGVDVHVLTTRGCAEHAHPGITVHPVMKSWSWMERPLLEKALKDCAPDAVLLIYIGWVYNSEFMITFAPTFAKRVLPGVPFITRFENAMGADVRHTSLFSRAIRKYTAWREGGQRIDYSYGTLLRDSDRIIVLSERHRQILAEVDSCITDKAVLIPPPANMRVSNESRESARPWMLARLGLGNDAFIITYIGFIHSGKGIESLLRAFAMVSKRRNQARLLLMGGTIAPESGNPVSYIQTLHKLADDLGVSDRVSWTGAYTWESAETSKLLRASDVCVLPFRQGVHLNNSSFASVAAHHLPVVTTRGELLEDQFVHGENVYLCPPESPEALAAAMDSLMTDPLLRERLQTGIAKLSKDWFSWDRALDETLAVCRPSCEDVSADLLDRRRHACAQP